MDKKPEVTQGNIKARKIVYYILGVLETLFTFRLIFKILGANPQSVFVKIIYAITSLFLAPFDGIFRNAVADGAETQAVLEPKLLIAMVSYVVLVWGIIKMIELKGKQKDINNS
ncbi:MAG: YggT family protein [Peptostreptococcaceae bacterium]|nr:YggT family protein [Peptostreptococcaceae bacterium]